jgi:hypothetical protein
MHDALSGEIVHEAYLVHYCTSMLSGCCDTSVVAVQHLSCPMSQGIWDAGDLELEKTYSRYTSSFEGLSDAINDVRVQGIMPKAESAMGVAKVT